MRKPTSPAPSSATSTGARREHASRVTSELLADRHQPDALRPCAARRRSPGRARPRRGRGRTRSRRSAPAAGAAGSPPAAGCAATIASRTSSMPMPSLALARTASRGVEADHLLDLLPHPLGLGARQVDLVQHRDDLEVVVERQVDVGQRLRLDALRGVDHQDARPRRRPGCATPRSGSRRGRACRSGSARSPARRAPCSAGARRAP